MLRENLGKLLICVLTCATIASFTVDSVAQNSLPKETASMNVKDVAVIDVMNEIAKQTNYRFSYNVELESILKAKRITLEVDQRPVEEILPTLFSNTDIIFKVTGKSILLSKKNATPPASVSPDALLQTVKGRIVDKESKSPLV